MRITSRDDLSLLRSHPFTAGLIDSQLALLAELAEVVEIQAGRRDFWIWRRGLLFYLLFASGPAGLYDRAIPLMEKALAGEPISKIFRSQLGCMYLFHGQQTGLEIISRLPLSDIRVFGMLLYAETGHLDKAIQVAREYSAAGAWPDSAPTCEAMFW